MTSENIISCEEIRKAINNEINIRLYLKVREYILKNKDKLFLNLNEIERYFNFINNYELECIMELYCDNFINKDKQSFIKTFFEIYKDDIEKNIFKDEIEIFLFIVNSFNDEIIYKMGNGDSIKNLLKLRNINLSLSKFKSMNNIKGEKIKRVHNRFIKLINENIFTNYNKWISIYKYNDKYRYINFILLANMYDNNQLFKLSTLFKNLEKDIEYLPKWLELIMSNYIFILRLILKDQENLHRIFSSHSKYKYEILERIYTFIDNTVDSLYNEIIKDYSENVMLIITILNSILNKEIDYNDILLNLNGSTKEKNLIHFYKLLRLK